jgi:hypothetical protein
MYSPKSWVYVTKSNTSGHEVFWLLVTLLLKLGHWTRGVLPMSLDLHRWGFFSTNLDIGNCNIALISPHPHPQSKPL